MNTWNFHGYIAVPLEAYGKKHIGNTFFTADEIEDGNFVDAMLQILSVQYGSLGQITDFSEDVAFYDGTHARDIPKENAIEMFENFERLLKNRL